MSEERGTVSRLFFGVEIKSYPSKKGRPGAAAKQHGGRYAAWQKKHFTHTIAHLERAYQRRFDRLGTGLIFVCPLTLIALMLPRG